MKRQFLQKPSVPSVRICSFIQIVQIAEIFRVGCVFEFIFKRYLCEIPNEYKLRFIFIELPSFTKEESACDTDFERWIYVLKNMETLNRMPFTARKSVFEKLEKIVDIASLSKEERIKYDESIKVYRDNLVTMEFAEQKGRAEGLAEGLAQGIEKGKIEERRTIALQMKRIGIPVVSISGVTGLSESEINDL